MQTGFSLNDPVEFSLAENSIAKKKVLDIYRLAAFKLINFKVFKDTGWIKANRLTILFGNN